MSSRKPKPSSSRKDRSPCRRPTPPSLWVAVSLPSRRLSQGWGRKRTLFLGVLLCRLGRSVAAARRSACYRSRAAAAGADVGEKILDILALERLPPCQFPVEIGRAASLPRPYLCEQLSPDRLDVVDLGGFEECLYLVGLEQSRQFPPSGSRSLPHHVEGDVAHRDIDPVVGQDQRRVGRGELGGSHCNL